MSSGTYLVQKHASAHIGESNEDHDNERADQIALGPGLDDEPLWRFWHGMMVGNIGFGVSRYSRNGAHGFSCAVVDAEVASVA